MIGHWPDPYPDELLYSVAARYRIRTGYPNTKDVVYDLFGPGCALATVELPRGIDHLVAALPSGHLYHVDKIIEEHTAFPFYSPFLSEAKRSQVKADMRGAHKAAALLRVGIIAGGIPIPEFLRSCPVCDQENEARYGETYWQRLHQLAGIEVCSIHEVFLENSNAQRKHPRTRHGFVAAQETLRPTNPRSLRICNPADAYQLRLAVSAATLFNLRGRFQPGPTLLQKCYAEVASAHGLVSAACGRVRRGVLDEALKAHCPSEFLSFYNLRGDWPCRLLRSPRATQAPLRHLVLMDLLGISPAAIAQNPSPTSPACGLFNAGPWPCHNPVCTHAGQTLVRTFTVERGGKDGEAVGIFRCPECGFAYARRIPCESRVVGAKQFDFVRDYGRRWREVLRYLWTDGEVSLRFIARTLAADPLTIKRHALDLGLSFPRQAVRPTGLPHAPHRPSHVPPSSAALEADRKLWQQAITKAPVASTKVLRAQQPALYARLYRRDRAWLASHRLNRSSLFDSCNNTRVNWPQRDAKLAERVADAAARLRCVADDPGCRPRQVSTLALAREIGAVALIAHHRRKLPLTVAAIAHAAESREDYALRRIEWAVGRYSAEVGRACAPAPWRIARRAGLRVESLRSSERVQAAFRAAFQYLETQSAAARRSEATEMRAA